MTNYPRRLIEVDLPIARISAHARREKSIRHGHISTLHIWWARRPLAACRAVICAALWPDPADLLCPVMFREKAIEAIKAFASRVFPPRMTEEEQTLKRTSSAESLGRWEAIAGGTLTLDANRAADLPILRLALLDFIADFANWDNSTVPAYLETSRTLTRAAHEASGGEPGTRPLVADPFAGGGSIPLEALRVGADAFASDLNPVAVLLNKVVLEYIPKYSKADIQMKDAEGRDASFQGLAEAVRYWGNWVKEQADKELAEFYPKDADGSTPIAYLWARTILSEAPGQGDIPVEVPLMRSMWLCKKPNRKVALRWVRDAHGVVKTETIEVTYADGVARKVRRPLLEIVELHGPDDVDAGTVSAGSATCPVTGYTTKVGSVREQLSRRFGGALDARCTAVVLLRIHSAGRSYRLPCDLDCKAWDAARDRLRELATDLIGNMPLLPAEQFSGTEPRRIPVPQYGIHGQQHLYSPRQLVAMSVYLRTLRQLPPSEIVEPLHVLLTLVLGKQADLANSLCAWEPIAECPRHLFSKQAINMVWDFAEGVPTSESSGSWSVQIDRMVNALMEIGSDWTLGEAHLSAAQRHLMPDNSVHAIVTDPPYYFSVPYSDLSDFFYVWMRRSLSERLPALFQSEVTPKADECVQNLPHAAVAKLQKGRDFYERSMCEALSEACRVARPDGIGVVVFAHSDTEAWESLLEALIRANWLVTASWPLDTEMASRIVAQRQRTLASSVHLVCRPRENNDGTILEAVGEWRDVLGELPKRIHEWMPRLAAEGVVGADAIFACLGPALEIFSRYSRVEKSNGEAATLREYLEFVWAAVSTEALSLIFKEADAAGLEPDARLTAMWLWTIGGGGMTNGKPIAAKAGTVEVGVEVEAESGATRLHPGPLAEGEVEDADEENEEEDERPSGKGKTTSGFTLEFDAARKIAQGLGVRLEQCESLVEIKGDKARLLSVAERSTYLFGKGKPAATSGRRKKPAQKSLFEAFADGEDGDTGWGNIQGPAPGSTVLDRVHQSMVLFAANRGELLKRFLVADGVGKDPRFWKLADNLNKLYPSGTEERRWVEGVLARKKGLGL